MAPEHGLQPFLEDHVERRAQTEQQVFGRGSAILHVMRVAVARRPVPIGGPQTGAAMGVQRPRSGGHEAQPRRHHQPLLRAAHRRVHAPIVHLERHGRERRHDIDHEQGRVARGVDARGGERRYRSRRPMRYQPARRGLPSPRPRGRRAAAPRGPPGPPRAATTPAGLRPRRPARAPCLPRRWRSVRFPAPARGHRATGNWPAPLPRRRARWRHRCRPARRCERPCASRRTGCR